MISYKKSGHLVWILAEIDGKKTILQGNKKIVHHHQPHEIQINGN